jgi:hypothetical protein
MFTGIGENPRQRLGDNLKRIVCTDVGIKSLKKEFGGPQSFHAMETQKSKSKSSTLTVGLGNSLLFTKLANNIARKRAGAPMDFKPHPKAQTGKVSYKHREPIDYIKTRFEIESTPGPGITKDPSKKSTTLYPILIDDEAILLQRQLSQPPLPIGQSQTNKVKFFESPARKSKMPLIKTQIFKPLITNRSTPFMNVPNLGSLHSESLSFRGINTLVTPAVSSRSIRASKQGISGFGKSAINNNSNLATYRSWDSLAGEPDNFDEELVIENKLKDL